MDSRSVFIVAMLGLQALLPMRYYAGLGDPYDERFAWRMFSPERMLRCSAEIAVDGSRFEVTTRFHTAWETLVNRGRFDVTRAMSERICRLHPNKEVRLRYGCRLADGATVTFANRERDVCPEGRW